SGARAHPVNTGGADAISPNRANARSAPRSTGSANTGTAPSTAGSPEATAEQSFPASTTSPAPRSGSGSGSGGVSEVVAGHASSVRVTSSASTSALRTQPGHAGLGEPGLPAPHRGRCHRERLSDLELGGRLDPHQRHRREPARRGVVDVPGIGQIAVHEHPPASSSTIAAAVPTGRAPSSVSGRGGCAVITAIIHRPTVRLTSQYLLLSTRPG